MVLPPDISQKILCPKKVREFEEKYVEKTTEGTPEYISGYRKKRLWIET